jgi:Bifunctional DNA primase/polymerase, N-terminal
VTALSSLGRHALRYAELGWFVAPLAPRTKNVFWTGHPAFQAPKGEGGFKLSTRNASHLRAAWGAEPECNICLHPGPSRLVVLDGDGPQGEATLRSVGALEVPTLSAVTGRAEGGRHLYFTAPDFVIDHDEVGPGTTLRHYKGYVVAPPSVHPVTGKAYQWRGGIKDLKPLPPRLLEQLCPSAGSSPRAESRRERIRLDGIGPLVEGRRHTALSKVIGWLARRAHPEDDPALLLGLALGFNQLYSSPPQDEVDVRRMLEDFLGKERGKRKTQEGPLAGSWEAFS